MRNIQHSPLLGTSSEAKLLAQGPELPVERRKSTKELVHSYRAVRTAAPT